MRKIEIFDTTMRDGEQSPGIDFSQEDKLKITERLVRLGVSVIEAGFPANDKDFAPTKTVAENIGVIAAKNYQEAPVICGLARATISDIDLCWQAIKSAPKTRIHTFIATSPLHMQKKLHMSPDEVVSNAAKAVKHAKSYTDDVEFSPEDATRSDLGFLLEVIKSVVEAGATTINIPDTTGYSTPYEIEELVSAVYDHVKSLNTDAVVSAHCHNDLGMATANSLAAIRAGATQIECTINGIGERAGNAPLEEITAALKIKSKVYGAYTDINSSQINLASQHVAKLSGYVVAYNKAVVGRNAFVHESGIHQGGVMQDRATYEILNPVDFGKQTVIVDGKHSGRAGKEAIQSSPDQSDEFYGQNAAIIA